MLGKIIISIYLLSFLRFIIHHIYCNNFLSHIFPNHHPQTFIFLHTTFLYVENLRYLLAQAFRISYMYICIYLFQIPYFIYLYAMIWNIIWYTRHSNMIWISIEVETHSRTNRSIKLWGLTRSLCQLYGETVTWKIFTVVLLDLWKIDGGMWCFWSKTSLGSGLSKIRTVLRYAANTSSSLTINVIVQKKLMWLVEISRHTFIWSFLRNV